MPGQRTACFFCFGNSMTRFSPSLQLIILGPVLVLMFLAGLVLYFLVLKTVSEYANENIRATLDTLLRSAVTIADSEVDRQNRESQVSDSDAALTFQLNTRIRFEDFARDQDVGVIVVADGTIDFATGLPPALAQALVADRDTGLLGQASAGPDASFYVASARFSPWNWEIVLAKDAGDFEALIRQVRLVYAGSALALLATAGLLILALRQFLVKPIYQIADDFSAGMAPRYQGIAEFQHLSNSIGTMLKSLRGKTQELETILQSMSDAIAVYDADMRLSVWNRRYAKLYRYPDTLLRPGTHFADIMRYNIDRGDYGPVDPDEQIEQIVQRARSLTPPRFEIDRADGTSVEVRRAPMPDGGFVTTYTDITHRKQSARLEAANEAKSRFLENMSHDLRKPIAAVIEECRLLLASQGSGLKQSERIAVGNINGNATHLLGMVDELLEMARIEAGQIRVNPKIFALSSVIAQVLRVVEPGAKAKGLELNLVSGGDIELQSDARLLSRILVNLLSNAVEYTAKGSIALSVHREGARLTIRVSDTGQGIPPEKCDIIFDKFQRVEPTAGMTRPGIGLGLGLAISREFARLLGGDIAVESELGKGSIFILDIAADGREDKQ
jgi:signal transduction histidine kinase